MSVMKYALVTGVSTGIGYGTLREFISRGYHVFGSVRKEEDSHRLASEFPNHFTPLIFDVTDQESVDIALEKVSEVIGNQGLSCLVNNSGIAVGGPLQFQDIEMIDYHFQVNVIGLMRVTKAFLPLLGAIEACAHEPGLIINISSVAGKVASPFVGAYVGSKHAVEGMSDSLRRELLIYGIDVIVVGPGAVQTPIWNKGMNLEEYTDTPYGKFLNRFAKIAKKGGERGLTIEFLGKNIVDIAERKKPKTRYAFVPKSFSNWTVPRLLPPRMMDSIIKKKLFGMK